METILIPSELAEHCCVHNPGEVEQGPDKASGKHLEVRSAHFNAGKPTKKRRRKECTQKRMNYANFDDHAVYFLYNMGCKGTDIIGEPLIFWEGIRQSIASDIYLIHRMLYICARPYNNLYNKKTFQNT
ncbi:hypothetical protein KSP39_PZI019898 [Platanthera zijinensis]|uniref:Uncharacterized protein n=1 Tax=Platanthera zijinensis TaxID=2320716 RepID=A0AAP0AZJ2_9ASPA